LLLLTGCSILPFPLKEIEEQPETPITPTIANQDYHFNYYYSLLDNEGKSIYNALYESIANFEDTIKVPGSDYETFLQAQMAFNYDHPEYYWVTDIEYITSFDKVTKVTYTQPFSQEEYEECSAIASDILAGIDAYSSTYDKLLYIYEYIINTTDYDVNSKYNQDIRSVLMNQASVCAGYSRTFQYLCDKLEIPCIYVTGTGKEGEGHSWNEVCIDDSWYWVDVTWGDPVYDREKYLGNVINYNYFCVNDSNFLDSHTINTGFDLSNYSCKDIYEYPECYDNSYNYYVLEGCYFEYYDRAEIDAYIGYLIENGYIRNIELKFSNEEAYNEAYDDLFDKGSRDGYIFDIIRNHTGNIHTMRYELRYSDSMYYICTDIYIT
ncbi:MAG: hypothetical protein KBT48_11765, partial [Firmicutes bacterium]|nr:hypothetical protein [Bacillota bacterium]